MSTRVAPTPLTTTEILARLDTSTFEAPMNVGTKVFNLKNGMFMCFKKSHSVLTDFEVASIPVFDQEVGIIPDLAVLPSKTKSFDTETAIMCKKVQIVTPIGLVRAKEDKETYLHVQVPKATDDVIVYFEAPGEATFANVYHYNDFKSRSKQGVVNIELPSGGLYPKKYVTAAVAPLETIPTGFEGDTSDGMQTILDTDSYRMIMKSYVYAHKQGVAHRWSTSLGHRTGRTTVTMRDGHLYDFNRMSQKFQPVHTMATLNAAIAKGAHK